MSSSRCRLAVAWIVSRALSVPIFAKILGIGVLVATIFGGMTLMQIHGSISRALHEMLKERTLAIAGSLVASLERPMSTGDVFSVDQKVLRTRRMFPDIRYIIVCDRQGEIVTHTFEGQLPADLRDQPPAFKSSSITFRVLGSEEGLIFDAVCPVIDGYAGSLRIGVTDQMVTGELAAVTRSMLTALGLCSAVGVGLALLLTHILTSPVHHLVSVANSIRNGDFEARADVIASDEIGVLSGTINEMAESLCRFRREVEEKERSRLALIERIVHTQEEERKSISRELHDQLGQSLSALLLSVQSICRGNDHSEQQCCDIESRIRRLIEDVQTLAWGMRPSILDDYGLDSALKRHVEDTKLHAQLAIDYQLSGPPNLPRLPGDIEIALYRIFQEAITNILRHSRATQASVVLLRQSREVTLLVEDNGQGFDSQAMGYDAEECLGLTGIRERAALVGGRCDIDAQPGQGTTIRVRIPLPETAE